MKTWARIGLVFILLFVLLAGSVRPASAAVFDEDGHIEAGEVIDDDLFLSGEQVVMDGTVNGLLLATGETVTINGTVNGDAILLGNTIIVSPEAKIDGNIFLGARTGEISGQINGSFFGGAAAVELAKSTSIGRNLYYGGYSFQTAEGSTISRDLFVGGYQAILAGEVQQDAYFGGGALELSGQIGRNLKVQLGDSSRGFNPMNFQQNDLPQPIPPGLRIAESATIGNQLIYTSSSPQSETINTEPGGGIIYQTPVPDDNREKVVSAPAVTTRYPAAEWLLNFIRDTVALLAIGALALWLLPAVVQRTVAQAREKAAPAAGYGLLAIFSGYFIALVALVVILFAGLLFALLGLGGLSGPIFGVGFSSLALFVAIFTFLVSTLSKLVVAFLIGYLLLERTVPQAKNRSMWALVIGVLIYVLVSSIPIIGLLIGLAATLIGVGAMWLAYQAWRKPAVYE